MINAIKNLFVKKQEVNFAKLLNEGAQIIDVRSPGEYQTGHIKGSVNIPVDQLQHHLSKVKKDKPVITCCASGMRSGMAKRVLLSNGFTAVYNGGGWSGLQQKIR
jgi:rhodanese-related sulfurtransferase